jgi:ribonuclease BN (tRNA processing enzyme)
MRDPDRRRFLGAAAACCAAALWPFTAVALAERTRLILLGTAGGPRPKRRASAPAQVIVHRGAAYLVDCGNGVGRQMTLAGVPPESLRHVFLTHHHSDHNADYGTVFLLAWGAGLKTAVDAWGPPPLRRMTELFLELNATDIRTRIADEGRVPLAPLMRPHEITRPGVVLSEDGMKVTAALVHHPPLTPAFAYRFDTADRSIVISGDTARSDALIELARGADVLVHETLYLPAVDRLVGSIPNASSLKKHIVESHTSAEDCGRVAQAAGVKTLVLSHFVPTDDEAITEEMWAAAARAHFHGRVIVGKDLMEIRD